LNLPQEFATVIKSPFKAIIKSSLVRASGIYTISSVLNASIPFLLLPFLTKYLSKADFGVVSIFGAVVSFIMPFVSINMEGAIARRYYADKKNISVYIGNCFMLSFLSFLIVLLVIILFRNMLFNLTSIPPIWMVIGTLYCFSQFMVLVLLTFYQVSINPLKYGAIQILQSITNFSLSFILVVFLAWKWEGRLSAQVVSSFLFAIVAVIILISKKFLMFKMDLGYMKNALKFGSGLIPHALGGTLILLANRVFLLKMVSIEEAGLYGVASQVASVISFVTLSFNNAYVPWLYSNLSREKLELKKRITKLTYVYFVAILLFGLVFYFSLPIVFKIFIDVKFFDALKFVFWIILGFVFQGMYFMVTNYISYSEKTYYQAIVTVSVGAISILMTYFFIKFFGPVGAAIAFCFSYFLMFIFTWIFSNKVYPMPWFKLTGESSIV
jgi:O-antigen/teichoic acid export membrane protein